MGIVFRQAVKTTIVIATGAVLGSAINYIYVKVFPQNLVGVSRNLLNQGSVVYLFLLMGTVSLVHTFAQRYDEDDPRRPVLITYSMLMPLVSTALFCIPYFAFKDFVVARYQGFDRQYIEEYYIWLPPLCLLLCYLMMLEYYLASRMKVAIATAQREVILRLGTILLIGGYFAGWLNFHQFVISTVIIHVAPIAILWYTACQTQGFHISFNRRVFSREDFRSIIHYAWYHMLLTVTLNLTGILDVLLIAPLSKNGLKDVAVYNLTLFLISILTIPYRAMSGAAFPKINEAFVQRNPQLNNLFTRSAINIQVVSVGMWLIVACNLHNVVTILPKGYEAIAPAFLILSLGRMMDMATGLNTELISITNHYKFTFRLSVLLLIAIVALDRIFIPKYGLYGAAWVSTGTVIVFNLLKVAFLYQKMKVLPFNKQSIVILALGCIVFLLNMPVPALQNAMVDAVLRSILLVVVFSILLLVFRPSPDLSQYLRQIRKSRRLF